MTAEQAGDQLADVKLQHTAATGVSRTEAKFLVTVGESEESKEWNRNGEEWKQKTTTKKYTKFKVV